MNIGTEVETSDDALLTATPISRARMDLLWFDPPHLAALGTLLGDQAGTTFKFDDGTEVREHTLTREDYEWAKSVESVVDAACRQGEAGMYELAIANYKKALLLAPGCDLFLMSIGTSLAMLGRFEKGLRYLKRAAEISPTSARIRNNLDQVADVAS